MNTFNSNHPNESPILYLASYIRYSCKKQSDGYSIEYQSNANKNLIDRLNGEFVDEFIDRAVSGYYTRIGTRGGMIKLLQAIEDGKVNCVVFYEESRLSRRIMDVYRDFYRPIMKANPDVKFYRSCDGTLWSPEDSDSKRNLIDAYKESAKKKAYAVNGQTTLIQSKIRPGSRLPLGIHAILPDRLEPDENLAIVLFIFELASWGYSEQKIADILTSMDFNLVLPKVKKGSTNDTQQFEVTSFEKEMKEWSHTSIHYILNNPIYIGKGTWNRRLSRNNSTPGPKEQLQLYGDFSPIIPISLWNLAHAELDRKRIMTLNEQGKEIKKASIRMDTSFKLSGIVQCSKCKLKLITKNSIKNSETTKLHTRSGKPLCYYFCPNCNIRIDSALLDELVLGQIKHQLSYHYKEAAVLNKMKSWIRKIDTTLVELNNELKQEEYYLQDSSIERDLPKEQYETYLEVSSYNIELLKWRIEELNETHRKCCDFESSKALHTLVNRIQGISIDLLNTIEQRHIMFMTIEKLTVKLDKHSAVIIDELSYRGVPLPYRLENV